MLPDLYEHQVGATIVLVAVALLFRFFFRCDGLGFLRFPLISLILCKLMNTVVKLILFVVFPVHSDQEEVPILNFFFAW